ncbi:MAG: ferredoxin [Asgard group archaeon]|nr:ferredoxin [Asgard group archaeon]
MTKYRLRIERMDCIKCGNCYSLDPKHFEPDDNYISKIINGETNSKRSIGQFNDNDLSIVEQAAAECPAEIIFVEKI